MAFKIVNGKLVQITSQSDFGTPAQKAAGQQITGTLGNITKSPSVPKKTSTPQKITFGSGDSGSKSGPGLAAPAVPLISAGSNVQQTIAANTISAFQAANQPFQAPAPALGPAAQVGQFFESAIGTAAKTFLSPSPAPAIPSAPAALSPTAQGPATPGSAVSGLQQHLQNVQAQQGSVVTGTLGLGQPTTGTGTTFGQGPNQIVTMQDLRFRTLGNPVTLGQFQALGAGEQINALLTAFLSGEKIDPVFLRFLWNQGRLEADPFNPGQFQLSAAGNGAASQGVGSHGGSGGGSSGGTPRFAGSGLGLTNWRI